MRSISCIEHARVPRRRLTNVDATARRETRNGEVNSQEHRIPSTAIFTSHLHTCPWASSHARGPILYNTPERHNPRCRVAHYCLPSLASRFFSYSMICLLQLHAISTHLALRSPRINSLPAREELALLRHLPAVLALSRCVPDDGDKAQQNHTHDGCVTLPICRLRIPSARGRPDVLGVAMHSQYKTLWEVLWDVDARDLAATAHDYDAELQWVRHRS